MILRLKGRDKARTAPSQDDPRGRRDDHHGQRAETPGRLDELARAHAAGGTFSGAVLVAHRGDLLLRQGYGQADVELGVAATPDHAFRIGSVAKTFTAAAVMRLVDAGRLSPEDVLGKYLPGFPGGDGVTLHHLLSNTSGIPDHITREDSLAWCGRPHTLEELVALVAELPPLFAPGARFSYSNANWALLARVVELVTGRPFAAALEELVLRPLGLRDTTPGWTGALVPRRASGYALEDGSPRPARHIDLTVELGAGGLYSTVDELRTLLGTLREPGFLSAASLERMTTPVSDDGQLGYGYGVMAGARHGRRWLGHNGGTFGFTAFATAYPEEDAVVVVLSNLDNGSAMNLERDLAAALFGEPYELPGAAREVAVPAEVLARYAGVYRSEFAGRPVDARVAVEGGALTLQFPLLPKARLKALSDRRFHGHMKGAEVVFEFVEEDGRVTGMAMDWAGYQGFAPRVG